MLFVSYADADGHGNCVLQGWNAPQRAEEYEALVRRVKESDAGGTSAIVLYWNQMKLD